MIVRAILARSTDGIIGTTGKDGPCLPWSLPPDLKRFRKLTTGHAVIMGRTTFDSIGKPLPNRKNIVVTRDGRGGHMLDGVLWASSPEDALEMALSEDKAPFVIGGATIYEALWPRVDLVYLTMVHKMVGLGVAFTWDPLQWSEIVEDEGEHEGLRYTFSTLGRKKPSELPGEGSDG